MVSTISATATSEKAGTPRAPAEAAQSLSPVVLPAGRDHLHRPVRDPDLRLVLLLPHPLDPVRHRVHRTGQLPAVLQRTRPARVVDQHLHLRLRHLGLKVVLGLLLGLLLTSQIVGPRLPALGGVLPRAGVDHRHRHHVQDLDGPVRRRDQPVPGRVRHRRPRLVDRSVAGSLQHRPDRRLEGRRHRHADLHRRAGRHPAGVLRSGPGGRGQQVAELLAHHHSAGDAGHGHRGPAVADRWSAVLRADLGDHRRRIRASPAT